MRPRFWKGRKVKDKNSDSQWTASFGATNSEIRDFSPSVCDAGVEGTVRRPRDAVLETVELLENILVQLPAQDILTAQRACRTFRDVVYQSRSIKRKLFFLADTFREPWTIDRSVAFEHYDVQKADSHASRNCAGSTVTPGSALHHQTKDELLLVPVELSPVLARVEGEWYCPRGYNGPSSERSLTESTECTIVKPLRGVLNSRVSWHRMYLCDPPCTRAYVSITFGTSNSGRSRPGGWAIVEDPKGLTMGSLVEAIVCKPDMTFRHEHFGWRDVRDIVREQEGAAKGEAYIVWDFPVPIIKLEGVIAPIGNQWREDLRKAAASAADMRQLDNAMND